MTFNLVYQEFLCERYQERHGAVEVEGETMTRRFSNGDACYQDPVNLESIYGLAIYLIACATRLLVGAMQRAGVRAHDYLQVEPPSRSSRQLLSRCL
jgi:hypothetical protein